MFTLSQLSLNTLIRELFQTKTDFYSLTIPLIASALGYAISHNDNDYDVISKRIKSASHTSQDKQSVIYNWLLSRVLFAANARDDRQTLERVKKMLDEWFVTCKDKFFIANFISEADITYGWVIGYYTTVYPESFSAKCAPLIDKLTSSLVSVSCKTNQADKLWLYILFLYASATSKNNQYYTIVKNGITKFSNLNTIVHALEFILIRSDDSSDYPAWGISIVLLSAAIMADTDLYEKLTCSLTTSLSEARIWGLRPQQNPDNQWKAKAEIILATLNQSLAKSVFPNPLTKLN